MCAAQATTSGEPPKVPGLEDLNKYPGLLPEVGRLTEKFQRDVKFPAERSHSDLLPLLPSSTVAYIALPNYGESAHQTLTIFRQGLKESPDLRAWWTHGELLKTGPKIEDFLDRFSQVSEYLGDEIVVSGLLDGRDANVLILAEVRKPGLKAVLQKTVAAFADQSHQDIRILDPQELASIRGINSHHLLVLIRPDFVVASTDPATLRSFNERLNRSIRDFVGTPFAQRILESYQKGVTLVGAVDLRQLIDLTRSDPVLTTTLQRTGFADLKYLVWEHHLVGGKTVSQAELTFTAPRHGVAAWLGAPTPLASLDFVSPRALFAGTFVLNNPPQMFEDIRGLTASDPNALLPIMQMEHSLGISLKDDILAQLGGEITLELDRFPTPLDGPTPSPPEWKAILQVKDAKRLQQTLGLMLTAMHIPVVRDEVKGVPYSVMRIASPKGDSQFAFAFIDDYLVFASSPDTLVETIQLHQGGEALGKSHRFLAALPPGHNGASAIFYQDPTAMAALQLQRFAPQLATSITQTAGQQPPGLVAAYADPLSIVESSTNPGVDVGVILVGAAIAIPNLLRSRVAANEASAVGMIRTMNTAQVNYASTYPDRGYAPDLATLGPAPGGAPKSEDHAGYLPETMANWTCTAGHWCENSGYHFMIKASCGFGKCRDFVAMATPVSPQAGSRSFCSTSDGILRMRTIPPLTTPIDVSECKRWPLIR